MANPAPPPIQTGSFTGNLYRGMRDVPRGFSFLLKHHALWIWAAIPFVINILLFAGLVWLGWHFAGEWLHDKFFVNASGWKEILGGLLMVLVWLLFGLITLFLFVPLAVVIASPFNDIISEKVEKLYGGVVMVEGFTVKNLMRGMAVGLKGSLQLGLRTLGLLLCASLLGFIPLIGPPLSTAASALITIRFLALEFTSYSMERRYYTYKQKRAFLKNNRARTIGLGGIAFVFMMIPGLNAIFIPVSAVAGTLLFCDAELAKEREAISSLQVGGGRI